MSANKFFAKSIEGTNWLVTNITINTKDGSNAKGSIEVKRADGSGLQTFQWSAENKGDWIVQGPGAMMGSGVRASPDACPFVMDLRANEAFLDLIKQALSQEE